MIDDPRGRIDYDEVGEGPTLVLVPGSCSTGAAWRPIISQWGNRFRCVTTSLLGYGGSAERRTAADPDIAHEAEVLEAVVRRAGHPVHLIGHSFGGLVSLVVALRKQVPLLSLAILEAPAANILNAAGEERHYRAFRQMNDTYFGAYHAGDPAAIGSMIDFFGGAGTFVAWPERVRGYAIETTPVNLLDWRSAYDFPLTPAMLATVAVPTVVARGGAGHPAVQRANELLAEYIPGASGLAVAGAAHFMIASHAKEMAALIARHVERAEEIRGFPPSPGR